MTTAPPSALGGGGMLTVSAETVTGWHVLKVDRYSETKGIDVGKGIDSSKFRVGDHSWFVRFYPDGFKEKSTGWISIFLHIDPATRGDVKARFTFSLLDHVGEPVSSYTETSARLKFSSTDQSWGYREFIKREVLESSYLKDDSFQIRCDVTIVKEFRTEASTMQLPIVPPPDLHRHFGDLLTSEVGGDVTFKVAGEQITAHRYVLAIRSSVFMAEFFGPMKEKATACISIDDMEARVFKAMLHFIYTDSLPEIDEGDKVVMAQHLLVAADRYNLERLKLICEHMLCSCLDTSIVATTLVLAEQHGCHRLKEACFKFLMTPSNLKAVVASDGFEHLMVSCPSLFKELLIKVAP